MASLVQTVGQNEGMPVSWDARVWAAERWKREEGALLHTIVQRIFCTGVSMIWNHQAIGLTRMLHVHVMVVAMSLSVVD